MMTQMAESPPAGDLALQAARRVRTQFRFGFDSHDNEVVRVPPGNATRLTQQLANTVQHKLLQIVPLGAHSETAGAFANAVWQSVAADAERRVAVQRLYLVPPGYFPPQDEQDESADRSKGWLQVRSLSLRDITDESLALPITNLWLIDDSAVVSEVPDGLSRWQVSARSSDVERFRYTWQRLWELASARATATSTAVLTEPLLQSADAMATVAKMACRKPLYGQETCTWFHGVWQYLRLFDMVTSPDWHADFFTSALSDILKPFGDMDPGQRVNALITGSADYSMPAYVLSVADRVGARTNLHILDRCRTPLVACEWYFRNRDAGGHDRRWHSLRVHEMDMASARRLGRSRYDLIATDSYLTSFELSQAVEAAKIWYDLLRPGGAVITTVRLHPLDVPRGAGLDEVSDFTLRAQAAAERWRIYLKAGVGELTAAARLYAISMRSYDLGDADAVLNVFCNAGFKIEHQELGKTHGELREATHLRLVARKL